MQYLAVREPDPPGGRAQAGQAQIPRTAAERLNVDAISLASHGRGGVARMSRGSRHADVDMVEAPSTPTPNEVEP